MTHIPAQIDNPDPPPDWETLGREILCPLCEYNLRGLSEARCPECGHRSTWFELMNAADAPDFFFEYGQKRNLATFFRTLFESLNPVQFWSDVGPTLTVRAGRLAIYAIGIMVIYTFLGVATMLYWFCSETGIRPLNLFIPYSLLQYNFLRESSASATLVGMLWPILTWLSLMIFQETIAEGRIRMGHICRCVVYAGGAALLSSRVLLWLLDLFYGQSRRGYSIWSNTINTPTLTRICLMVLIGGVYLHVAYNRYLRFPHAGWTVLASQLIVLLIILKVHFVLRLGGF